MAGRRIPLVLRYFGLQEQPFGDTPDPRFLLDTESHREALASLEYAIGSGVGFASLIAEPGMGKTTLLYALMEKFGPTARTAFIFQTQCDRRELLHLLLKDFGVECAEASPAMMYERLRDTLLEEARAGRRVLAIIDEAQNLELPVFESLRLLSNFENAEAKLLQIVLAGQPSLAGKLSHPDLLQLQQRISVMARLLPLGPNQVRQYVEHRLQVAGRRRGHALFTDAAIDRLTAVSDGIPRNLNRLAFNAMSLACALEKTVIGTEILDEVAADLDLAAMSRRSATWAGETSAPYTVSRGSEASSTSGAAAPSDARVAKPGQVAVTPAGITAYPARNAGMYQARTPASHPAAPDHAVRPGVANRRDGGERSPTRMVNRVNGRDPASPWKREVGARRPMSLSTGPLSVYQLAEGSAAGVVGALCLLILILVCWFAWTAIKAPSRPQLNPSGSVRFQTAPAVGRPASPASVE